MSDFFDKEGFLNRLHALREKTGLQKGDFGKRVGVQQLFSRYSPPRPGQKARKVGAPSAETLIRIAKEFNTSVDWLLFGKEPHLSPTSIDLASKLSVEHPDQLEEHVIQDEGIPMESATQKGDTVLVDRSVTEFKGQGLYVIQRPGEHDPVVRGLFQRGQSIWISEGPLGGSQPLAVLPEGTLILGSVVGRFGPV